jgi:lipopolysaccharide biosynthesis glycosyltransferase
MFEKTLTLDWVRKHSVIIHYCGRNKPWKENYIGVLNVFYNETVLQMNQK